MKRVREYMDKNSTHRVFDKIKVPVQLPKKIKLNNINIYNDLQTQSQTRINQTCGICLYPFLRPITLMKCRHSFCYDCAKKWFDIRENCPLCKSSDIRYLQYQYLPKYGLQHRTASLSSLSSSKNVVTDENESLYECNYQYIYLWDISKKTCTNDNGKHSSSGDSNHERNQTLNNDFSSTPTTNSQSQSTTCVAEVTSAEYDDEVLLKDAIAVHT